MPAMTFLTPRAAGTAGHADPVHFMHAIRTGRVLLTYDHEDFTLLNELVLQAVIILEFRSSDAITMPLEACLLALFIEEHFAASISRYDHPHAW
jgi:hypothetical protein